jgi:RimJ/RimL family protein N-acetyltransferase
MPGPVFLRNDRVTLRPPAEEDLPFLGELVNHPDGWPTTGMAGPHTAVEEREWLESRGDDPGVSLLIAADGDPVGTIGLDDPNPVWGTAGIGYAVHPDGWNGGYATAAVALLTRFGFAERRLGKLHATVFEHNPASMRVLEKAGYAAEATLDREAYADGRRVDCHRYAAHADEWTFPPSVEDPD